MSYVITFDIDDQEKADKLLAGFGYKREHICCFMWEKWANAWKCSNCGSEPPGKLEYRPTDGYCQHCGYKVVD